MVIDPEILGKQKMIGDGATSKKSKLWRLLKKHPKIAGALAGTALAGGAVAAMGDDDSEEAKSQAMMAKKAYDKKKKRSYLE